VYTVPDVIAKGYRPSALRYLLLSSHYRKQLNFTWTGVEQAEESLRRIVDFLAKLDEMTHARAGDGRSAELEAAVGRARDAFRDALASDLNTAAGLAAVFDLVREGNSAIAARKMSAADAQLVRAAIEDFDRVLGVVALRRAEDASPDVPVDEIEKLIGERKAAKQRREFARADEIRASLAERGILLEDTPAGTRWKKK
jgi:cysteinyl-tRNA synthetase